MKSHDAAGITMLIFVGVLVLSLLGAFGFLD